MRSIWTGSIAFGLVNVPVKAYGATEDHDLDLHQVHDADGGRIRYQRRCDVCGKKIDFEHIDKAFEDGDKTVVLHDEDMESLLAEKSREIEVVQFVPNDQLDPIMFERSYYLEPDSKSPKAYRLLVKTLENTELTAVVKFALRQKTRLGVLRIRDDVLVLQGILWSDEVRDPGFIEPPGKTRISAQELTMASTLVEQFRGDFKPGNFTDEYQVELRRLIDEKLKQGDSLDTASTFGGDETPEDGSGGTVIDLMEALKRSVEKKRTRTAGDTDTKNTPKKPAAKKPANKTTPKKSEAGKSATKKRTRRSRHQNSKTATLLRAREPSRWDHHCLQRQTARTPATNAARESLTRLCRRWESSLRRWKLLNTPGDCSMAFTGSRALPIWPWARQCNCCEMLDTAISLRTLTKKLLAAT